MYFSSKKPPTTAFAARFLRLIMHDAKNDAFLRDVFLTPVRKCASYQPAFGRGKSSGLSLLDFQILYGSDSFYAWLGLDDSSVYAAHKAAGGLTSVYRQIGIGSERLFRAILAQALNLSEYQMDWRYEYAKPDGKMGIHTLDACVRLSDLEADATRRFENWLRLSQNMIGGSSSDRVSLQGAVFEVRQGYKSADSKRQNADLRYGVRAYQAGLLPAFAIMSMQVSKPVIRRYRSDGMLVLTGIRDNDPSASTFAFFEQVVGYDLAGFFERNKSIFRAEITRIIETLLSP